MTLRIAVTGGIGSGKTAVSDRFAALGAPVVDTDVIARDVVQPGHAGHTAIGDTWGERFFNATGRLDRRALRDAIFADHELKTRLDALLHPLIRRELEARLGRLDAPYAITVIPLLLEAGFDDLADRILLVDAARETRIARAMRRDNQPREAIEAIIARQAPSRELRRVADDIIDNNADPEALDEQVSRLHRRYLDLAASMSQEFTPPGK